MDKLFNNIIRDICKEKGIKLSLLSNGWIMKLEKDNKIKFILGYKFGINSHSMGMIFDDKYATYEVLNSLNIPIIKHDIFYSKSNNNDYAMQYNTYDYIKNRFEEYNQDIVLKINNGSLGNGVYHINNYNDLKNKYDQCQNSKSSFSICPFYNIENEYRSIILDNKIQVLYKKIKPIIIGDGVSTIKELLVKFNKDYYLNYNGTNKDIILKKDEKYEENWQFNLSKGSISSLDIQQDIKDNINNIVNQIINNIDVGFCSIDIVKTTDNRYYVMEINSGVMIEAFANQQPNGYDIAKNIYSFAIDKLFQ